MLFCRSCGNYVPDDSTFCGACGKPLTLGSSTASQTFQRISPAEASPEKTLTAGQKGDASLTSTEISSNPTPSGGQSGVSGPGEEKQVGEMLSPPLFGQPIPPIGRVPTLPSTPQAGHVPSVSGVPNMNGSPALHGTPSLPSPGNVQPPPHAPISSAPHTRAGQPGQPPINQTTQHHPPNQFQHTHQAVQQHALRQGRRWLRRAAQRGATHSGAGSTAGTISTGALVKAVVVLAIVAAAGVGAVKAVPQIFQHGHNMATQPTVATTQPMPPTLTTCPAAGTTRAMVSAPLVPKHDQALIFSTGTKLERYDSGTGSTTRLIESGAVGDAQVSPDGVWVLVIDQVKGQSALQMVRVDGQGQQTLYCAPAGQFISSPVWSPDQKTVAFNQGTGGSPFSSSGSSNTYLLQPRTGKLSIGLLQPVADPQKPEQERSAYFPLHWIDNTHLSMRGTPVCCGLGGVGPGAVPAYLYLLDTSRGFNQHAGDLKLITPLEFGLNEAVTFSPDRGKLLLCVYTFGANNTAGLSSSGPSPITEQSAFGGSASTIYTDPNNAIFAIETIDQNDLLIVIANSNVATQNGLWKLNLKSQQMTRLLSDSSTYGPDIQLNGTTMSPWGNTARDGSMYAVTQVSYDANYQPTSASLLLGSLQGGSSPKTLLRLNSITGSNGTASVALNVVGWTVI